MKKPKQQLTGKGIPRISDAELENVEWRMELREQIVSLEHQLAAQRQLAETAALGLRLERDELLIRAERLRMRALGLGVDITK